MVRGTDLRLAPIPKRLSRREGVFNTADKRYIRLEAKDLSAAGGLVRAAKKTGLGWEVTASPKAPKDRVGLTIRLDGSSDIPKEGYKLAIRPEGMEIIASTPAGAFYGACTLAQISCQLSAASRQKPAASCQQPAARSSSPLEGEDRGGGSVRDFPCLTISDWPDFPARGVMLDISRDKVPTMETLYHLIDLFAGWKINQFQLYTEHTFAYLAHPIVWETASPITGEEILALDAYCEDRFIELVPNQNSFGHMERWLKHDKYRPMAEAPHGCDTVWGHFDYPFSLCPGDRRSIPFVRGLFDELLPHFSSRLFNVGLDETIDLGLGRSKKVCEERGTGRVYLDFLLEIYRLVKERGRTMQFWGDIILKYPELIPELPSDGIALEWGYESDHAFQERCAKFAESGIRFYVCPGTSSWNTLAGRTENAIGNITNAAKNGLKQGAIGLLNTDWGDNGHWQPLSVSYLGFMVGAMTSWNSRADVKKGLAEKLSLHAFGDPTGKGGRAFYDLGDIYRVFKKRTFNSTVPWQMLFRDPDDPRFIEKLKMSEFEEMERRLAEIADAVQGDGMTCVDGEVVREEIEHLVRMLQLAADVGKMRLGGPKPKALEDRVAEVKIDHELVWLMRNRPGGLADGEAKMKVG